MIRSLLSLALVLSLGACQTETPEADTPEITTPEASGAELIAPAGAVTVSDAFVTAAPAGGTGGVFMTITGGAELDMLIGVESGAAERAEIHETYDAGDGLRGMRPVEDGIAIPAGETVSLEPGGYHIMLLGLTSELVTGGTLELIAIFSGGDVMSLRVPVIALDQMPAASE